MSRALTILFLVLCVTTSQLFGECVAFDVLKSTEKIPFFVEGVVTEATPINELARCLYKNGNKVEENECRFSFTIRVKSVLKGTIKGDVLKFSYHYWLGCPGVKTFEVGDELIFYISEVKPDGSAKLFDVNCGQYGVSKKDSKLYRQLKRKLKT